MTKISENPSDSSALKRALFAVKDMRAKLEAVQHAKIEPVAIIGMACRFPGGANSPETFWELLHNGVDAISEVPSDRWDIETYYDPDPDAPGKMYTRKGGFIEQVDQFDPQFFGISPREAVSMDPQQRLLLEVSWEALEYAGLAPDKLAGSQTGVFVGISSNDYPQMQLKNNDLRQIDAYIGTGGTFSVAAGRLSYILGLQGPTLAVDTACSSSLVAIYLACQSLRAGQSDLALAGGVNLILSPEGTIYMAKAQALSPDGLCKTFDAAADGYVRGEGCGVIVLKRLSDAMADNDNILAVIRGSAINHDGRSSGLTVPNGQAQQAVIRSALADAGGLEPYEVNYVEAHGTGTPLGDPIEVRSVVASLGQGRSTDQKLTLGSVKTNIGHLEAAAGIAGLMKIVLALQHEAIPPHLHLQKPTPHIDWDKIPVEVPTKSTPWPAGNGRRLAGVSSFGFSGTNAHILIEEAPVRQTVVPEVDQPLHLFSLAAKNEAALTELAEHYEHYLATHPDTSLADIAYTVSCGRSHFAHRLAVIGESVAQVRERLSAVAAGQEMPGIIKGQAPTTGRRKVVFMFTGQGAQYVGMGRELYETQPSFRATVDQCDQILQPYLDRSLLSVLYPENGESPINETAYTQPALFAVEYALAQLWQEWGIKPSVVLGHSVGEYVAACVAGVFSLEDALKLIAARGRLMQALPQDGTMAAIFASATEVESALNGYTEQVTIAAFNSPTNTVISGRVETVEAVMAQLAQAGLKGRQLTVSHAFHSPLMEPMLGEFEQMAQQINYNPPRLPIISNIAGQLVRDEVMSRAEYWTEHVLAPVRFAQSINLLQQQGYDLFLEIGPKPTLSGLGRQCLAEYKAEAMWLPSLRAGKDDWQVMLDSLGRLYVQGVEVDWEGVDRDYIRQKVVLPTYPFQRQRYWFGQSGSPTGASMRTVTPVGHPLIGERVRSPLKEILFEGHLGTSRNAFLADQQIFGIGIVPGAAYMEMGFAAAREVFGPGHYRLSNVTIEEALLLEEGQIQTVQLVLSPEAEGSSAFQIFSLGEADQWKRHAAGKVYKITDEGNVEAGESLLASIRSYCQRVVDTEEFYQKLQSLGLNYGPSLQGVKQLWQGQNEALGQIQLAPTLYANSKDYQLHPTLLDAAFQLLAAVFPDSEAQDSTVYLPVGLDQISFYGGVSEQIWGHAKLRTPNVENMETLKADITLFNESEQIVAEIQGLILKRVAQKVIRRLLPEHGNKDGIGADAKKGLTQRDVVSASTEERPRLVEHGLCEYAAAVLQLPVQSVDIEQPLNALGLDSLMALELKNQIASNLSVNISVSYFLEGATIADLVKTLLEEIQNGERDQFSSTEVIAQSDQNGLATEVADSERAKLLLTNLDQLSEDEMDALLDNLLAENEGNS